MGGVEVTTPISTAAREVAEFVISQIRVGIAYEVGNDGIEAVKHVFAKRIQSYGDSATADLRQQLEEAKHITDGKRDTALARVAELERQLAQMIEGKAHDDKVHATTLAKIAENHATDLRTLRARVAELEAQCAAKSSAIHALSKVLGNESLRTSVEVRAGALRTACEATSSTAGASLLARKAELESILSRMLEAFDDGLGQEWSADLLAEARKINGKSK